MKKIVVRISKMIVFGLLLVLLVSTIAELLVTGDRTDISNIRGFYYEPDNSIDVVTIGPSEMYTGYIPTEAWKEYGYTSYNFGAGAIPCNLYTSMLKEILKHQSPNLVVVNISDYYDGEWNYSDEVSMRKWIDNIPWSENKINTIRDVIEDGSRGGYYCNLWKYHENWKHPRGVLESLQVKTFLAKDVGTYNKGFLTNTTITGGKDNLESLGQRDSLVMTFSDRTEGYLREFLQLCKDENIENVLFIAMPHQMESVNDEVIVQIGSIVQEYGYDFINLDKSYPEIGIDDATDFSDGEHMNISGAEKFTKYIGAYIVEHYNVVRSSGYSENLTVRWNECYYNTQKLISMCKSDMANGVRKEHWEGELH